MEYYKEEMTKELIVNPLSRNEIKFSWEFSFYVQIFHRYKIDIIPLVSSSSMSKCL